MKNMKLILAICATLLAADVYAAGASETDAKGDVKDYKTYLKYAAESEQVALKAGKAPSMSANDVVRLKDEGIELSEAKPVSQTKDNRKEVYLGRRKQVALYDKNTHKVKILDANGKSIREGKISKFSRDSGVLAFTETRVFVIGGILESNGGFKIFDYAGKLIREVNPGFVDGYAVSNTSKYFAVTAGGPKLPSYFILFDMDGKEVWKQQIPTTGHAKIDFSRDDRYAVIKLPIYWDKNVKKERKLYVIDVSNLKIITEEEYEK